MNYDESVVLSDDEEAMEWYSDFEPGYGSCKSIQQAFCQYVPLRHGAWGDWTQLLRAGWLRAHRLAPFEDTDEGKQRWESVVQCLPEEVQTKLASPLTKEEEARCACEVLDFFSHYWARC